MAGVSQVFSLADDVARYVKACGKTSVLQTKPINPIQLKGLHLSPSLACDTVQLSNISYLSESFVKSLTSIKGKDNIEAVNLIKNAILKKMGYKNPELLNIYCDSWEFLLAERLGASGGFNPILARLDFTKKIMNLPIEHQISMLYHELDHVDKFVKLYKTVGEKKFKTLFSDMLKSHPYYDEMLKKGFYTDPEVHMEFYKRFSEGINIQGFNVKKWEKAMKEYGGVTPEFRHQYKYFNNPFEVSAYSLQSKINNIIGLPIETARDTFPRNYSSMINSLKRQGITDVLEQEKIVKETLQFSQLKYIDTRLLELYRKRFLGAELTQDELKFVEQVSSDFDKINIKKQVSVIQKASVDAEYYINQGLFSVSDIMSHLTV